MGCITADYKDILAGLVAQDLGKEIVSAVIASIPICKDEKPHLGEAVREAVKRGVPAPWGLEPTYFNQEGKEQVFSSPSALVKELGLPMSGIQCDIEGKKCRATSAVEILRIHGYTVSGNGEPKKAAEGGTKLTVYHPQAPQLKLEKPKKKK